MPATITFDGTSFTTTALAATKTLSPIDILPKAFAPGPNPTLSPIIGRLSCEPLLPISVPALKPQ